MNIISRRLPIVFGILAIIYVIYFTRYLTSRDHYISQDHDSAQYFNFSSNAISGALNKTEGKSTAVMTKTNNTTTQERMDELSHNDSVSKDSSPLPINEHQQSQTTHDVKIVAFTDSDYAVAAEWWYQRMTNLTYNTHTLILINPAAEEHFERVNNLREANQQYRFETWLVDPGKRRKNKTRALWYRRIEYCLEQLKKGQSLLLTDVDNIFRKYVPLSEFQDSSYDAIFALEQRFPEPWFEKQGFVFCGGMTFLKATDKTIEIMEQLLQDCDGGTKRCDDQKEWNILLHNNMHWDVDVKSARKGKTKTSHDLLQDGFEGISTGIGKGFRAKVWDRDFAWRANFEESCPSLENNWVAMPTNVPHWVTKLLIEKWPIMTKHDGLGLGKISRMKIWENHCGENGTFFADPNITSNPIGNVTSPIELAFQRFAESDM